MITSKVSIIIAVFEPLYLIDDCLSSVLLSTDQAGINLIKEIIIIDNSQTGALAVIAPYNQLLTEKGIHLLYCRMNENLLHVRSMNVGLKLSSSEYVLFLNDDIGIPVSQGSWLSKMVDLLECNPHYGSVTIDLLHRDNTIYWVGAYPEGSKDAGYHREWRKPYKFQPKPITEEIYNPMACILMRRETLEKIPYDGINPFNGEKGLHYGGADHFWSWRVRDELDLKSMCCHDVWVYHYNERVIKGLVQPPGAVPIKDIHG